MDLLKYKSTILITCLYFTLYYLFIIYQVITKYYVYNNEKQKSKSPNEIKMKDIKYFSQNTLILAADRTVGNCLEQMIPFLLSFWLYSIFISIENGKFYGLIYIFTRAYYPFVFKLGGIWVLLSTLPNYICIWTMIIELFKYALAVE